MNNTIFVTIADDRYGRKEGKYSETQDKIFDFFVKNKDFGIDRLWFWKWNDIIKTSFYKNNKALLDNPDPAMNGRCYKPFIILEGLKSLNDGDFLIYNDVSPEWWNDVKIVPEHHDLDVIKNLCIDNGGILTTAALWVVNNEIAEHTHENFTMEICMNRMGMQQYKYSLQHASGIVVLQKTKKSMEFAEEWLYWNLIKECAAIVNWDEEVRLYGKCGHRHDQSISGLLINKMNNKLLEARLDPINQPYLTGKYNFLNFCLKYRKYYFINSNQPKSKFKMNNTFDGIDWKYVRTERH